LEIADLRLNQGSLKLLEYLIEQRFATATIVIHEGQIVRAEQIKTIVQAKDFEGVTGSKRD